MGKRQHWLPQFYLRGFRSQESDGAVSRVWTFFREGPDEPRLTSVHDLANQRYLYAPKAGSRLRDQSVEQRLEEIETLLGPIWPQVAEGFVDLENESIRKAMSLFVATLHARHPSRIQQQVAIHSKIVEMFERAPKDERGDPIETQLEVNGRVHEIDPRDWQSFRSRTKEEHHREFVSSVVPIAGEISRILIKRRWAIIATESPAFATCDTPLVLSHRTAEQFGFNTPGVTITLPLSPTRFLNIDDSTLPNAYYQSQPGFPEAMNHRIWCAADRYLLSSMDSHLVLRGIVQFVDHLKALGDGS